MSEPTTPKNESAGITTPQTPSRSTFALTEYTANPSPTPEEEPVGITSASTNADSTAKTSSTSVPPSSIISQVPEAFLLPNGYPDYLRLILTARVYEVIDETPVTVATNLSNRLECRVLFKREDLQPVFSFKVRGAYNKMAHLGPDERWKGVVACSAGNHAQGVAFSARKLKIPATIVMPKGTPDIKHRNVSRMGGVVALHGADFDEAKEEAHRLQELHGLTNIAPFDDPYVIAGQGTIGMELLRQTNLQTLEAVFCCVGGGGLIAGVGVYLKRIAPHVKVIGVETYDANAMVQSLQKGERVLLKDVGLFADGAAVKTVGVETFRVCSEVVDEIIQVSTDEICASIKDIFEETRSVVEPAGALGLAGLKKYVDKYPSENVNRGLVAILSGANMNFDRLRFVAERAAYGENKEALLSVVIPERPGAFADLVETIQPMNVTEFAYRYARDTEAHVLLGVSLPTVSLPAASYPSSDIFEPNYPSPTSESATTASPLSSSSSSCDEQIRDVIRRLRARNMHATNLSDDELAKTHVRYLVGGRSAVPDERLFLFEFPERQGALVKFLTTLQPGFNISLFHYRNYGGDVGKVLAGVQCPGVAGGEGGEGTEGGDDDGGTSGGEGEKLEAFLKKIGYPYREETHNKVYKTFLRDENS